MNDSPFSMSNNPLATELFWFSSISCTVWLFLSLIDLSIPVKNEHKEAFELGAQRWLANQLPDMIQL